MRENIKFVPLFFIFLNKVVGFLLFREERINSFLEGNEDKVEVIEIKWKTFIEHFGMIVYKIK